MHVHSQSMHSNTALAPCSRIPRTVLDRLPCMSIESERRRKDKVKRILDGEAKNHPPRHEVRLDLVRDPQSRQQANYAVPKSVCGAEG